MQYAVLAKTFVYGPNGGYEMKAACLKIYETIYNMIFIQIWYSSQNQAYYAVYGIVGLNYVWSSKCKISG